MSHRLVEEVFREAAGSIRTRPPTADRLSARAGRLRRGRLARSIGAGAAVVLTVAAGTWLGVQSAAQHTTDLDVAPVTRGENPAPIAWYVDGELHLALVVVEVPAVRDLVAIGSGAVYADERGEVVLVADDGARERLGAMDPDTSLVASEEKGWVAWTESGSSPALVVYDVTGREVVARRSLPAASTGGAGSSDGNPHPIAIDRDQLYYSTSEGDFVWSPPDGPTEPIAPADLLDVSSGSVAWQKDRDTIRLVRPFFDTPLDLPGRGARLSADGNFVLTRIPDGRTAYGTARLYDTRSGSPLPTGVSGEEVAIDLRFSPYGTLTYVVAETDDLVEADGYGRSSFSPGLELRTCLLASGVCEVLARFRGTVGLPVLASD